jgi:hypothetical protein
MAGRMTLAGLGRLPGERARGGMTVDGARRVRMGWHAYRPQAGACSTATASAPCPSRQTAREPLTAASGALLVC